MLRVAVYCQAPSKISQNLSTHVSHDTLYQNGAQQFSNRLSIVSDGRFAGGSYGYPQVINVFGGNRQFQRFCRLIWDSVVSTSLSSMELRGSGFVGKDLGCESQELMSAQAIS
jgi:hypothetical protein